MKINSQAAKVLASLRAGLESKGSQKCFDAITRCDSLAAELLETRDGRQDSQTLPFFARQLEHVMAETYSEEFPELRAANGEIVPIDSSVPEGAESYTYYIYSASGIARFASSYSGGSMPTVTMQAAKVSGNVENMEGAYAYNTKQIRNAAHAGVALESTLAVAERRAHDELLHKTALWGREDLGLPGLLNHANITISDAADNGSGSRLWDNKTPTQIIADVNTLLHTIQELTFGIEKANRVLMPRGQYLLISTTRLGAGDGTLTILEFLEKAHKGVTFEILEECASASSDSNLTADCLFAYTAGDKRKASLVVPMPFKQYPVQQRGLEFVVPCESSTGGIKMPVPLMCHRMDGV